MRRIAFLTLTVLATAALAACSSGATPTPATGGSGAPPSGTAAVCAVAPAGATPTATVSIKNFSFAPQPVEAKVGDVVAWKNEDTAPHSATLDNGACDTDTISVGASAMLVFNAPGTYTYHCKVHPSQMKDFTVEVK